MGSNPYFERKKRLKNLDFSVFFVGGE